MRIGVARSDAHGLLAVPLDAVPAGDSAFGTIAGVAAEWESDVIYVGLPLSMDGSEGKAAKAARAWARTLADTVDVEVRLVDERLSTVQAQRGLHDSGRSTRQSRSVIDSASAVVVLQFVLDAEAASGARPGELVTGTTA